MQSKTTTSTLKLEFLQGKQIITKRSILLVANRAIKKYSYAMAPSVQVVL